MPTESHRPKARHDAPGAIPPAAAPDDPLPSPDRLSEWVDAVYREVGRADSYRILPSLVTGAGAVVCLAVLVVSIFALVGGGASGGLRVVAIAGCVVGGWALCSLVFAAFVREKQLAGASMVTITMSELAAELEFAAEWGDPGGDGRARSTGLPPSNLDALYYAGVELLANLDGGRARREAAALEAPLKRIGRLVRSTAS